MLTVLSRNSIGDWLTERKLPRGVTRMVLLLPALRDPPPSDIVPGCSCNVEPNPVTSLGTCRSGDVGTDATPSQVITGNVRPNFPFGCCCCCCWVSPVDIVWVPDGRRTTSAVWVSDELRRMPSSSSKLRSTDALTRPSPRAADAALQKVTEDPRWCALPYGDCGVEVWTRQSPPLFDRVADVLRRIVPSLLVAVHTSMLGGRSRQPTDRDGGVALRWRPADDASALLRPKISRLWADGITVGGGGGGGLELTATTETGTCSGLGCFWRRADNVLIVDVASVVRTAVTGEDVNVHVDVH